jgi:predicted RNA binding protein YcfA (HicA-like mRNA interferase family)
MPKRVPTLKAKELVRLLRSAGCEFYREGKGDHTIYVRHVGQQKRTVPIDMGQREFSPPYVIRVFRQFGFTDQEIDEILAEH